MMQDVGESWRGSRRVLLQSTGESRSKEEEESQAASRTTSASRPQSSEVKSRSQNILLAADSWS